MIGLPGFPELGLNQKSLTQTHCPGLSRSRPGGQRWENWHPTAVSPDLFPPEWDQGCSLGPDPSHQRIPGTHWESALLQWWVTLTKLSPLPSAPCEKQGKHTTTHFTEEETEWELR